MPNVYTFKKYSEGKPVTWGVYSPDNELLCVCLYKRGARTITDHINAILGHIPAAAFADRLVRDEIKMRRTEATRAFKEHYEGLAAWGGANG